MKQLATWMTIVAFVITVFTSIAALAYGHGRAVERLDYLFEKMKSISRIERLVVRLAERAGIDTKLGE